MSKKDKFGRYESSRISEIMDDGLLLSDFRVQIMTQTCAVSPHQDAFALCGC